MTKLPLHYRCQRIRRERPGVSVNSRQRIFRWSPAMSDFDHLIPKAPEGRFDGVSRPYSAADVARLRGSVPIAHTLAERGANRLWRTLHEAPFINALGAITGNQAMQM